MGYYKNLYGVEYRRAKRLANFDIVGDDNLRKILKELPLKVSRKPIINTFRKGANKGGLVKEMRRSVPDNIKEAQKAIVIKAMKYPAIKVGPYFGKGEITVRNVSSTNVGEMQKRRKDREKVPIDYYYLLNWFNWGTKDKRDQAHPPKKGRSRNKYNMNGGIKPMHFIESSWERTKYKCQSIIDRDLINTINDFLKKNAYRA